MGYFVTFRHTQGQESIALRLSDDGHAIVRKAGMHGETHWELEGSIEPMRANELVADVMLAGPDLPEAGGEFTVGVGEGSAMPRLASFGAHHANPNLRRLIGRLRNVTDEVAATRHRVAAETPPWERAQSLDVMTLLAWAAAFFGAHVGLIVVWLIVGAAAMLALGALGTTDALFLFVGAIVAGVIILFAAVCTVYYRIGRAMGRRYGDAAPKAAFYAAMIAVVVPSLVGLLFDGGTFQLGGAIIFPLLARWGAKSG